MYPYRPGGFPPRIPMQRPMISPFTRFPMQNQFPQTRGLGNLLSKFLGKGNLPVNVLGSPNSGFFPGMFGSGFNPGAAGSFFNTGTPGAANILSKFTAGGIPEMLNNVQKVMGMAQQFGPMIQQYGPLVKNIPAMLKIMKELNKTDSTEEEKIMIDEDNTSLENISVGAGDNELPDFTKLKVTPSENTVKPSKPKLYI